MALFVMVHDPEATPESLATGMPVVAWIEQTSLEEAEEDIRTAIAIIYGDRDPEGQMRVRPMTIGETERHLNIGPSVPGLGEYLDQFVESWE